MIRKILVPVRGDGKGDNVLAHAAALARRHHAHVVVIHCRARAEDLLPFGVPIPTFLREQLAEQARSMADNEEQGMRDELRVLAKDLELVETDGPVDGKATTQFIEEEGRQADVIRRHGRLSDVVAVAQPDRTRNLGVNTMKSALFSTARPVLMCPPKGAPPDVLGKSVAIAWNGSLEATRAVQAGIRVIRGADNVTVISTGDLAPHGPPPEELIAFMAIHGVTASHKPVELKKSAGETLLAAAAELGADMLIMGAYGESHERELMFGGNTQTFIRETTMPLLMAH